MAKTNIFKEHKEITSLCEAIHAKTYVQQPFLSPNHYKICMDDTLDLLETEFGKHENPDYEYERIIKLCEKWMFPDPLSLLHIYLFTFIMILTGSLISMKFDLLLGIAAEIVFYIISKNIYFKCYFHMPRVVNQYIVILQMAAVFKKGDCKKKNSIT